MPTLYGSGGGLSCGVDGLVMMKKSMVTLGSVTGVTVTPKTCWSAASVNGNCV